METKTDTPQYLPSKTTVIAQSLISHALIVGAGVGGAYALAKLMKKPIHPMYIVSGVLLAYGFAIYTQAYVENHSIKLQA